MSALAPNLFLIGAPKCGTTAEIGYVAEEHVADVLAAADILVLPYREATHSGLVSLAQAVGLPPVATPVGGLKEQIVHRETGMLTAAATPEAIAEALRPVLFEPDLYARLSHSIRTSAATSWDEAAASTVDLARRVARFSRR